MIGAVKVMKEQLDFEISFFERLVKKDPDFVDALIPLAEAYTRKGFHEKALAIDERLVKLRREDPIVYYNLACSYALLGRKEDAFQALEQAVKAGYEDFEHLKRDSDLKSLREDARFKSLASSKSQKTS